MADVTSHMAHYTMADLGLLDSDEDQSDGQAFADDLFDLFGGISSDDDVVSAGIYIGETHH